MTGFDSVIHRDALLLFGMATVPVTHSLHTTAAKTAFQRALDVIASVFTPAFAPAFA